jgi:peptidyl-tRNA hydrolase, PTH1 family
VKLIAGLGNPGREYHWTRHNLGFLLLDELARVHQIPLGRRGLKSVYGRGRIGRSEVVLAKPQTYMNLSGEAVQRLLHFFKIPPQDLIVLHDDLDLPWGKIRIRIGGSSGGHRGILAIHQAIGSEEFVRLKIGIGRPPTPGPDPADYVLEPLTETGKEELQEILQLGAEAVEVLLARGPLEAMNRFHKEKKEAV